MICLGKCSMGSEKACVLPLFSIVYSINVNEVKVVDGFVQIFYIVTDFSYSATISYWDRGVKIAYTGFMSSFSFVSFFFTYFEVLILSTLTLMALMSSW